MVGRFRSQEPISDPVVRWGRPNGLAANPKTVTFSHNRTDYGFGPAFVSSLNPLHL